MECTECDKEIEGESFEAYGWGTFCSLICLNLGTPDNYPFKPVAEEAEKE